MPTAARKPKTRTDPWGHALDALARAASGRERAEALLVAAEAAASTDADLARFRFSLLASLRAALPGERISSEIAGAPRILLDGIELPGFSPADMAREATVRGLARARVFDAAPMLTASAVSTLLGSRSKNARQYANKLRLRGEIVGVPHQNQYLYPAFQFDEERRRVRPVVAKVNELLGAAHDPWGVASWWVLPHGALAGRAPRDLIGEPRSEDLLLEVARDEVEGE